MGITGLLPLLKSIQKPCHLKNFTGQTIGVDAYGWLHRGTVSCAMELALGKPTRKFVDFAMTRVRMLQHFGVTPFLVFDGDYLPSKAATESDRAKRREASKKLGLELLNAGVTSQAYLEFQKAVDVTPEMARQLIDELKATGVHYIVAPYEADAQLVYLERKGIIHGILSEDSDLLVFGAKCLLTKLDQWGNCIEINKADFSACRDVNLTGWSDVEFRTMAILSGCDYLASVNNMGLKTSHRMVRKYKTAQKIIQMLSFDGKYYVPKGYLEAFQQAELTFLHQRVFCPISNKLVYHTEPESHIEDAKMPFIGAHVVPSIAIQVATGDLNPMTKNPIVGNGNLRDAGRRNQSGKSRPQLCYAPNSNNLKKGVSIEQFFKPKRVPLAEMDPNCFQPSQSQQMALHRNSGSWQASPILPRPYLQRSSTVSEPFLPLSAPPAVVRTLPWSTSVSTVRPMKRARLCEDTATAGLALGSKAAAALGRSRFFDPPVFESSPSFGRSKTSRSKKEDIYLYSDDSIEEAMLNLPDYDGWQEPKAMSKKITVFEEDGESSGHNLGGSNMFESHTANADNAPQIATSSLTQDTSAISSINLPPMPTQSTLPVSLSALKSRFEFTPTGISASVGVYGLPSPPPSVKPSRIPIPVTKSAATSRGLKVARFNILTPLESLGAKALNRSNIQATPPYTPTPTSVTGAVGAKRTTLKTRTGIPFPEVAVARRSPVKVSSNPADIPLPAVDEAENIALSKTIEIIDGHGSEDQIIPDSEEESEPLSPIPSNTTGLNLDRFSFRA